VGIVHQEHAAAQAREDTLNILAVELRPGAGRCAFQAVQHARLVALGLQAADHPRPGIRKRLVIQVNRVLRGKHQPQPEGARLLDQGQHGHLRRRVAQRRQKTKDFIHVEDRTQAVRSRLRAHPPQHLVEQQGDKEHALLVAQVSDGENRHTRLASRGIQDLPDLQ